jgi:glycine cleavage system protein P-like pyridoxal-binding family
LLSSLLQPKEAKEMAVYQLKSMYVYLTSHGKNALQDIINSKKERAFMYRPTVRYADIYKQYIDLIFHATTLDWNQIIRAELFTAAYSKEFWELLSKYRKCDVHPPLAFMVARTA